MHTRIVGVFGGLDLFGKSVGETWTELAETATKDSNSITVDDSVQWSVGAEIVVGSTDFNPWHTETFRITAIMSLTNNHVKLTLNGTLKFEHTGRLSVIF